MSSLQYYARPGRGQHWQELFGFSEACIIGDSMKLAGQSKRLSILYFTYLWIFIFLRIIKYKMIQIK
jgi:hypothetical protein